MQELVNWKVIRGKIFAFKSDLNWIVKKAFKTKGDSLDGSWWIFS